MRIIRSLVSACVLMASMAFGAVVQVATAPALAQELIAPSQEAKPSLLASIMGMDTFTIGMIALAIVVVVAGLLLMRDRKPAGGDPYIDLFSDPHVPRSPPD